MLPKGPRLPTVVATILATLAASAAAARGQSSPAVPHGLKDHLNVEYGVDFFGAGVFRSALRSTSDDDFLTLRGAVSTRGGWLLESRAVTRFGLSGWRASLWGRLSTMERNRFYGIGNLTDASQPSAFYQLEQTHLEIGSALSLRLPGHGNSVSFGPVLLYRYTEGGPDGGSDEEDDANEGGVMTLLRPYGMGPLRQLGLQGGLSVGTAGPQSDARVGLRFDVAARGFPSWLDLQSPIAVTAATLAVFGIAPVVSQPTVAVRLRAERVFGDAPFPELAYLGGRRSLRGFRKQRFGGDLSLSLNSELRLHAWRFHIRERGIDGGPLMLLDAGRVYVDGVSAGGWHVGVGGGLWLRDRRSQRVASLAFARSEFGIRAYVGLGFPFWQ